MTTEEERQKALAAYLENPEGKPVPFDPVATFDAWANLEKDATRESGPTRVLAFYAVPADIIFKVHHFEWEVVVGK